MSENTGRANEKPPSIDRMSLLWRRVNEHKMVQWSVAYVALAYAIQHAAVLTAEAFEWPHLVQQISMLLLAFGTPVVATAAWYHGEKASRRISGPELTIITLLLVTSSLLFYAFVRPSEQTAPAGQKATVTAARNAAASPTGAISLAVLPFANVTGDASQEFFSDGITDEISSALAKIADLRVVGRASAFQFKGGNKDLTAIGQALHATHLIEGSVRKVGNRVRISAELVQADNGIQVWSENYDRELTDVFAIQEDIAKAIAVSLRMPLGLKSGENLVNQRTRNESSYENYLKAMGLVRTRNPDREADAAKLLEQVVAAEPDFAPAWALLGFAYNELPLNQSARFGDDIQKLRPMVVEMLAKAEAAARRAIQLDPKIPDGYAILAGVQRRHGKFLEAAELSERALALDPNFPEALNGYSLHLAELGYLKRAIPVRQKQVELEPFVPAFKNVYRRILFVAGRTDEALAQSPTGVAEFYASQGRFGDAIGLLQASVKRPNVTGEPSLLRATEAAIAVLRTAPKPAASPKSLPKLGSYGWVYMYVGAPERYLDYYEESLKLGFFGSEAIFIWTPSYKAVRQTQRFKTFVKNRGLVDYWRAKGWPEQCHPVGADDFACE